jgi:hypothetical protein
MNQRNRLLVFGVLVFSVFLLMPRQAAAQRGARPGGGFRLGISAGLTNAS